MFAKIIYKKKSCKCGSSFVNTIFILAKTSAVWEGDHKFDKMFFN